MGQHDLLLFSRGGVVRERKLSPKPLYFETPAGFARLCFVDFLLLFQFTNGQNAENLFVQECLLRRLFVRASVRSCAHASVRLFVFAFVRSLVHCCHNNCFPRLLSQTQDQLAKISDSILM